MVTVGGRFGAVTTASVLAVALPPRPSDTVTAIGYVLALWYVCVAAAPEPAVPSPKFH